MTGFLGALPAAIVTLSLLTGAVSHVTHPAVLGDALRAHGVLGPRPLRAAAVLAPAAEGVLGVAGAVGLLTRHRPDPGAVLAVVLASVLVCAAALFGVYALYTRRVLALGRGGPCGCSHREVPLSPWVTGRAAALAVLAAAGAALTWAGPTTLTSAESLTLLLAAPACTVLLWSLPAAMYQSAAVSSSRSAVAEGVPSRWTSPRVR